MKKGRTITLLVFIVIFNHAFSQKSKIVREWVMMDTLFISQVTKAHNISTKKLFEVLNVDDDKRDKLGYNYYFKNGSNGKGYISFWYNILYFKDEIVAYELSTYIPIESKEIKKLYKEKLSKLFEIDDDYKVISLKSGMKKASQSLFPNVDTPKEIEEVMTPFIGVTYGKNCGVAGMLLKNRRVFNKIITPSNCKYLLYSINPATRMMAVEYFYCNLSNFSSEEIVEMEKRIKEIEKSVPLIETCSGCLFGKDLTKEVIKKIRTCK